MTQVVKGVSRFPGSIWHAESCIKECNVIKFHNVMMDLPIFFIEVARSGFKKAHNRLYLVIIEITRSELL